LKRTSESHVKRVSVRLLFALKRKKFLSETGAPYPEPHTPPPTYTLYTCIRCTSSHREGGRGESGTRGKVRGERFTKLGRIYQHDWLYLQPINSEKRLPLKSCILGSKSQLFSCKGTFSESILFIRIWPHAVRLKNDSVKHKVQILYSTTLFVPSSELGPLPLPLQQASVPPPPEPKWGTHSPAGGGEGSQIGRPLCLLCGMYRIARTLLADSYGPSPTQWRIIHISCGKSWM
jgi:hypothetical protein